MSLTSRIHANQCKVQDCSRERAADSDVCRDDLNAKWRNLLDRQADGSYLRRRALLAREDASWRLAA